MCLFIFCFILEQYYVLVQMSWYWDTILSKSDKNFCIHQTLMNAMTIQKVDILNQEFCKLNILFYLNYKAVLYNIRSLNIFRNKWTSTFYNSFICKFLMNKPPLYFYVIIITFFIHFKIYIN